MSLHDDVAAAKGAGFTFLLGLTAFDEVGVADEIRVVVRLLNPDTGEESALEARTDRDHPALPDLSDLFAGATFLQRQAHDFFGVEFVGGDNRPLIHHGGGAPMRKDVLLEQRQVTGWPGALEPGSRAPPQPPQARPAGVPDPAVLADPASTPADVALSATGARVRRLR
nr:NADH-quinone oxidoreductase subunit C [Tessaracoccus coleopterorum]